MSSGRLKSQLVYMLPAVQQSVRKRGGRGRGDLRERIGSRARCGEELGEENNQQR